MGNGYGTLRHFQVFLLILFASLLLQFVLVPFLFSCFLFGKILVRFKSSLTRTVFDPFYKIFTIYNVMKIELYTKLLALNMSLLDANLNGGALKWVSKVQTNVEG